MQFFAPNLIILIISDTISQTASQIILITRKARNLYGSGFLNGGGGGIRTHGTLARTTVFKTAPINRSGTPPKILNWLLANHTQKKNYCKGGKLFF